MLESHYENALFHRKGNTISLTTAREILSRHLEEAIRIQHQIEYDLSTLGDTTNAKGRLKIGASTSVALYIIPKILSAFHQQFPNIEIHLAK